MARDWMYLVDRTVPEFLVGLHEFLHAYKKLMGRRFKPCPCIDCKNLKQFSHPSIIHSHLLRRGFKAGYTCWTEHGEEGIMQDDADDDEEDVWNNVVMDDGIQFDGPTADVSDKDPQVLTNLDQMLHEGPRGLNDERDIKKFK